MTQMSVQTGTLWNVRIGAMYPRAQAGDAAAVESHKQFLSSYLAKSLKFINCT